MPLIKNFTTPRWALLALGLALACSALAAAQTPPGLREVHDHDGSMVSLGFMGIAAVPVRTFAYDVNTAGGGSMDLLVNFDRHGNAALRFEGAYIQYGNEHQLVPVPGSGGLYAYDVNTRFYISSLRAGPQLQFGPSRVRVYLFGTAGLAYFATRTSVDGDGCACGETNFDDTALSLAAGGGLRLALSSGRRPVSLTLGTSYVHNQQVDYLRPGDITFTSQGYEVSPVRNDVDFVTFEVGLKFAL